MSQSQNDVRLDDLANKVSALRGVTIQIHGQASDQSYIDANVCRLRESQTYRRADSVAEGEVRAARRFNQVDGRQARQGRFVQWFQVADEDGRYLCGHRRWPLSAVGILLLNNLP